MKLSFARTGDQNRPDELPGADPLRQFRDDGARRGALVLLLERSREEIDRFLTAAQRRLDRFHRIVFVTTAADLRPFHQRGKIVELLPSLATITEDPCRGPWQSYVSRRHAIILAKWQPRWQLSYGLDWQRYLDGIRHIETDGRDTGEFS